MVDEVNHPAEPMYKIVALHALALFFLAPLAVAQADNPVLGRWVGTSEENQGQEVTVQRDAMIIDGARVPIRFGGPGVMLVGPADAEERVTYEIRGDEMTVRDSESTTKWRRVKVAATPTKPPGNPLTGNPLAGNPLAARPAPDPFVRRFAGDDIELTLTGSTADGYRGTLTFRGAQHPAKARAEDGTLRGSFEVQQTSYDFEARLDGDRLTLTSGGAEYRLVGDKLAAPSNPLAQTNPLAPGRPISADVDVTGPAAGTTRLVNRTANITCDLPDGWSVIKEGSDGCVINPGFREGQSLDVVVTLHCLPLDAKHQNTTIDAFLMAELPDTRRSLAGNGVKTSEPEQAPVVFRVGNSPAAAIKLRAETNDGRRGLVWLAIRVEGDKCLVCNSIFLDGNEAAFLPRVERAFATLRPASGQEPAPAPTPRPAAGKQATLILEKRELKDPGMNGMVSHSLLVPKSWAFEGGVRWTQHANTYVHFVARLQAPGGAELTFDFNRSFAYTSDLHALAAKGQQMGGMDENGSTLLAPPQRPGEVALQVLVPQLRPTATAVRLVDAKTLPDAERELREIMAPILRQLEQSNGNGVTLTPWLHVEEARVSYTEGGREWEELFSYTTDGAHITVRSEFLNNDNGGWELHRVRSVRAPRGSLDAALPTMVAIAGSLRETPQWSTALHQLKMRIQQIKHEGNMAVLREMGRRSQIQAANNAQLSDMQMASWREQQASSDRLHRATINSIVGVEDYKTPGGSSIAVDNNYDRVFQDRLGNVIMTNDPGYDPSADQNVTGSWSKLERIRHVGG